MDNERFLADRGSAYPTGDVFVCVSVCVQR